MKLLTEVGQLYGKPFQKCHDITIVHYRLYLVEHNFLCIHFYVHDFNIHFTPWSDAHILSWINVEKDVHHITFLSIQEMSWYNVYSSPLVHVWTWLFLCTFFTCIFFIFASIYDLTLMYVRHSTLAMICMILRFTNRWPCLPIVHENCQRLQDTRWVPSLPRRDDSISEQTFD